MTAIIKACEAVGDTPVRALEGAPRPQTREEIALRARIARLEEEVAERERLIASLRDQAESAYADGHTAGRATGAREANDDVEARFALLDRAIGEATAGFGQTLASLEGLAALLARECLERMFGETSGAEVVLALLRKQVATLERAAIVHIEVAEIDFPNAGACARLAGKLGLQGIEIDARARPQGSCTIRLQLGEMEIGLDRQWGALSAALAALVEPLR